MVDVDARTRERRADGVEVDGQRLSAGEHLDAADGDTGAVEREAGAAASQRGDDPAPVGVGAVHGALHQRAEHHGARRAARLVVVRRALHGHADRLGPTLGVGGELLDERGAHLLDRVAERGELAPTPR